MAGPAYTTGTINLSQNADWGVLFVYTAGDVPIDLTGSILRMQIRKIEADATAIIDVYSPDGGIEFADAIAGEFLVTIPRAKSERAAPGAYVVDLVQERVDGTRVVMFEGVANITMGVTRF